MATRLYGINRGKEVEDIVEGAGPATQANNLEVNIDLAIFNDAAARMEAVIALEKIQQWILGSGGSSGKWPPA